MIQFSEQELNAMIAAADAGVNIMIESQNMKQIALYEGIRSKLTNMKYLLKTLPKNKRSIQIVQG